MSNLTLSSLIEHEDYEKIKRELLHRLATPMNYDKKINKLHKLGLKYTRNVLSTFFLIDNDLEWDNTYYELEAYKICLNDCITLIETNLSAQEYMTQLEDILASYEETLYSGFLSSSKDIIETNLELNIRQNFKFELNEAISLI